MALNFPEIFPLEAQKKSFFQKLLLSAERKEECFFPERKKTLKIKREFEVERRGEWVLESQALFFQKGETWKRGSEERSQQFELNPWMMVVRFEKRKHSFFPLLLEKREGIRDERHECSIEK